MNKYKPIRLFRCPGCDKILVRRTRRTTLESYCLLPTKYKDDEPIDTKMKAYGKQQRTN